MRLTVLLLVVFAHAIAAVGVPPFTKAENWHKFHEEAGCFGELFDYGTNYRGDVKCMTKTAVFVIPDFSSPDLDQDAMSSQVDSLYSFVNEITDIAFPAVHPDDLADSLFMDIMTYNAYYDEVDDTEGFYPNADPVMTEGGLKGSAQLDALGFLDGLYGEYQYNSVDYADDYDDAYYIEGLTNMIYDYIVDYPLYEEGLECGVSDNCFILFSRVNPVTFYDDDLRDAITVLQQMGFQIITFDDADTIQASLASGFASDPVPRFAHLIASSPFSPNPELAAARLVQAVKGGHTSACMSYGVHHMLTYDGFGYVNQQIGDFTLAKDLSADTFEVQVRNEWCPPTDSGVNVVCTTGLAVRVADRTIAFYYDVVDDLLAVTIDGVLVKPGYLIYDQFEAYAVRHVPNGYDVAIKTDFTSEFAFVTATFRGPATVAVYPPGSLRFGLGGLCGTYDGCAADEFYASDGTFVDDADTFARSWQVHGGASIFEQPKYNGLAAESMFVQHAPFVPADWAPYVLDPAAISAGAMMYCSHFGSGPLYDACVYEAQMYIDLDQLPAYLIDYDVILMAVEHVCPDMCENGWSRMGGFTDVMSNCSLFCDLQAFDADMEFDFPDTARYRLKLPIATSNYGHDAFVIPPLGGDYVFQVKSTDCCDYSAPQQVMVSVDYVFQVKSTDCCDYSAPQQVMVSVDCEKQVRIDAQDSFEVRLDEFAVPVVEVWGFLSSGDQLTDNIHVMWQFLATPTDAAIPIANQYSLRPTFVPQAAGDYVLQVIATDGCSVSADVITVTVACYDRDYKLRSYQSDTMVFKPSKQFIDSVFSATFLYLDESCLAPLGVSTEWTQFPWSFTPIYWDVAVAQVSNAPLEMDVDTVGDDVTQYTFYWMIDDVLGTVDNAYEQVDDLPLPSDWSYWYIPSEQHVPQYEYEIIRAEARSQLTQSALEYYKTTAGVYTNFVMWYSVECWLYTEITFSDTGSGTTTSLLEMYARNAYREYDNIFSYYDQDYQAVGMEELPIWLTQVAYPLEYSYAEDNFYYHTGHCPGQYKVTVTLDDDFACNKGTDNYLIDVSCVRRPLPLTLTPCLTITYDYVINGQGGAFPLAYLLGADSQVPAYRDMLYQWFIRTVNTSILEYLDPTSVYMDVWWPSDLTMDMADNVQFDRDGYTGRRLLYTDEVDTYTATLLMTDHCMNYYEDIDFGFACHANVDARLRVDTGSSATISVPSGTTTLYANDTRTLAWYWGAVLSKAFSYDCAEETDVNLLAFWDMFRDAPIPYTRCYFDPAQIQTDPQTAEFTAFYKGQAIARVMANDQCAYDYDTVAITVNCDNSWPGFTITAAPVTPAPNFIMTYTQAAGGAGTWDDLIITAATSASTTQFYWFEYDAVDDAYYYIDLSVGTTFTVTHDMLDSDGMGYYGVVAYDGCNYDYKEFTVEAQCGGIAITTPSLAWASSNYDPVFANNASLVTDMSVVCSAQANIDNIADVEFFTDNICVTVTKNGLSGTLVFADACGPIMHTTVVTIYVTIDDGCQDPTWASITLTINCQWYIDAVAATEADADTVTWDKNRFPVVCMDGTGSRWNIPDMLLPDFGFSWRFVATPENSVFQVSDRNVTIVDPPKHDKKTHVAPYYEPELIEYFPVLDGIYQDYEMEIYDTIVINEVRETELISDEYPENEVLGACFRPDVEGDYQLELTIYDACLIGVTDTTWVHAVCNEPAVVTNNMPANVTLGERYQFEITAEDPADDLVYLWHLRYCEDDLSFDMTDYVTNAHAGAASFIPFMLGRHCVSMYVTDGCTEHTEEAQFEVTCGPDAVLPDPEVKEDYYKVLDYSGNGQLPLYMGVDNILPGYLFEWRLKGYQPRFAGPPQPSA